jgi:hypothetical protein
MCSWQVFILSSLIITKVVQNNNEMKIKDDICQREIDREKLTRGHHRRRPNT